MAIEDPAELESDSKSSRPVHNAEIRRSTNPARNIERPVPSGNSPFTFRNLTTQHSQRRPEFNNRQHPPRLSTLPQRPNFSLAGSYAPQQASYVAPGYYELNRNYNVPANKPVWGLAKPLPRVVRPGMRPQDEEKGRNGAVKLGTTAVETDEPIGTEAIPQVEKVSQREGKNLKTKSLSLRSQLSGLMTRGNSKDSAIEDATPKAEIDNPMDKWASLSPQSERGDLSEVKKDKEAARKMYDQANVLGPHLSDVQNVSSKPERDSLLEEGTLGGDLDAKLIHAAYQGELDEFEAEEAEHNYNAWSSTRRRFKEPLAECLGTMVANLIGISANLSVLTSSQTAGSYQSANWAWGLGITLGIYIAGGISGGHLNPAISLLLSFYRGFPFPKACIYIFAQVTGAFLAALIAFAVYQPAILHYSSTSSLIPSETGSAFYLAPKTWSGGGIGVGMGFVTEFVATAILGVAILALGDDSNAPPGAGMHALIVGFIVTVLIMAFGYIDGCGLNPARDLGPRLAAAAVGYGKGVFEGNDGWWAWGVWGGEIGGVLLGGFLYDAAVFVGGESPLNFPKRRWRRKLKRKIGSWTNRELEEGRR